MMVEIDGRSFFLARRCPIAVAARSHLPTERVTTWHTRSQRPLPPVAKVLVPRLKDTHHTTTFPEGRVSAPGGRALDSTVRAAVHGASHSLRGPHTPVERPRRVVERDDLVGLHTLSRQNGTMAPAGNMGVQDNAAQCKCPGWARSAPDTWGRWLGEVYCYSS